MIAIDIDKLTKAEKILLVEDLWDSISKNGIRVGKDEIDYVKERVESISRGKGKKRAWGKIKAGILV
jgi:putative addiction module component (TIGR02574 family)